MAKRRLEFDSKPNPDNAETYKQTSYNKIVREGASEEAKKWFKRPAYSVDFGEESK